MRAWIFDLDGTLVDTVGAHALVWQRNLLGMGMSVPMKIIEFWIGVGGRRLAQQLATYAGRTLTDEQVRQLRELHQAHMAELANPPVVLPGARELLSELSRRSVPWGIATSGRRPAVDHALRALEVDESTPLVTYDDVTRSKPDPQALLLCAAKVGVAPAECVMVGDAVWDMFAARRAEMLPLGVLTGGATRRRLQRAGAARVLRHPRQILQHLDELVAPKQATAD